MRKIHRGTYFCQWHGKRISAGFATVVLQAEERKVGRWHHEAIPAIALADDLELEIFLPMRQERRTWHPLGIIGRLRSRTMRAPLAIS
eukprot:3057416-Pyramimonas_sp.AAC.1